MPTAHIIDTHIPDFLEHYLFSTGRLQRNVLMLSLKSTVNRSAGRRKKPLESNSPLSTLKIPEINFLAFKLCLRPRHPDSQVMVMVFRMNTRHHRPRRRP